MDIEVLRRAPLFATLDDYAFRLLTDELTEVDLSRGASVFREGDPVRPGWRRFIHRSELHFGGVSRRFTAWRVRRLGPIR